MFVGHGLLAFALAAGAAHLAGWPRERALAVGVLAGGFGLAPDVDMLYAPVGVLGASGPLDAASGFWAAGNRVHRAVTHSLLVGTGAAGLAAAWAGGRTAGRVVAVAGVAVLTALAGGLTGTVAAVVAAAFGVVVVALAAAGRRRGLSPTTVGAAAALGLLTHPVGDLLTGDPPAFLYPLDATLVTARPAPFADATLNLLTPLALELGVAWLALAVYLRVDGRSVRDCLATRAGLGVGYGGAAFVLPAPTLDVSYPFVFSLLGVGLLLAGSVSFHEGPSGVDAAVSDPPARWLRVAATALAATTVAACGFTLVYLGTYT